MHPDVQEILLNEEQIANRVAEMAAQISQDYAGEEVIVVCVLNGAMPFTCDLMRKLDGDIILDDETIHNILFQLGIRTEIDINYYKGEVSINRLD